jgi:hypothetical protein
MSRQIHLILSSCRQQARLILERILSLTNRSYFSGIVSSHALAATGDTFHDTFTQLSLHL